MKTARERIGDALNKALLDPKDQLALLALIKELKRAGIAVKLDESETRTMHVEWFTLAECKTITQIMKLAGMTQVRSSHTRVAAYVSDRVHIGLVCRWKDIIRAACKPAKLSALSEKDRARAIKLFRAATAPASSSLAAVYEGLPDVYWEDTPDDMGDALSADDAEGFTLSP